MRPRSLPQLLALIVAVLATAGVYAYAFTGETPAGALHGSLMASDTMRPLTGINLVVRPMTPQDGRDTFDATTDEQGAFDVSRLPVGPYEVYANTNAYRSKPFKVTVLEGKTAEAEIRLDPGDPYLNLNIHQHAVLPGDDPRIALNGFRQGDTIRIRLYTVDAAVMLQEEGQRIRQMLSPVSTSGRSGRLLTPTDPRIHLYRTIEHRVAKRDAEGVFYDFEQLGKLKPGVYLIRAQGAKHDAIGWIMVTDLALVTKSAEGRVLAFSLDLRTGAPVPGAKLAIYQDKSVLRELTTDANGRADIKLGGAPSNQVSAIAYRGDSVAFMRFNPFGNAWYGEDGKPDQYRIFTYTERPVYRPGHTVQFKGVVRKLEREGYSVPSPRTVSVEVLDEKQTSIYKGQAPMNDHGSYAGEFTLSTAATGGSYTLTSRIDGEEHSESFLVASYRKPEWRVDVTVPKKSVVRGEVVSAIVKAEYYYGAPVADAKVEYTVYRSEYWSYWGEDEQDFGSSDEGESGGGYGEVVENGTARTDADGIAHVQFGTKGLDPKEASDYEYTVQATVSDLSDRTADGQTTVRVSAGSFRLDAKASRYVTAPGDQVTVRARLQDLEEKPVANVPVSLVAALQLWDRKGAHEKPLVTLSGTTNAKGEVEFPLTLSETGSVTAKLTAADPRGNRVEATEYVWVTTYDGGDYGGSYPTLSMVPDKKEYKIGDTAQILLNTDKFGALAILGVEAARVLDLQTVTLKRKSTVVRFPIKQGYEPNVFVTACFVKNREFITNQLLLHVNPEDHRLKVAIESDREVYHPGDTATFKLRTTDTAGKPVPAEVSFGVVDEAVYAIHEDAKAAMWQAFYPRRYNEVLTEFSFPQIYLGDADKDGAQITVRKKFPDTAYWDPFVRTDRSGSATVRVTLPDSLTSWRATAVAETDPMQIGRQTLNVRVMKELTLRLETPRSVTEGDTLTVSSIIHNYTPGPQDVDVELAAQGVEVRTGAKQRVHLEKEEAKKVEWEVRAAAPGDATFTATARAGAFNDGMQLTVPVRAFARQDVEYHAGAVTESTAQEELSLDGAATDATLEIRLAPSLAGTLLGSLDYLATFPYGCVEQTMSGFLPDVVLMQMLRDHQIASTSLQKKLPEMTTAGLLRLYSMQGENGAWGWWRYDQGDPWMTAYVMFGLDLAKRNGIEVNDRIRDNGMNALKEIAKNAELKADDAMFVAYVLAQNGARNEASELLRRFSKDVGKLQRRSQGYRVLALLATGSSENRDQARAGMEYLWSVVDEAGGLYHWSELRKNRYYGVPEDVESTAVILKAALALDAQEGRLPGVVRWLLVKRQGGRWISTRDTAWTLFALTDYLKSTGELKPDYRLAVMLNGKEIRNEAIQPADALREEAVIRIPLKELKDRNQVELRKDGSGTLYYSVRLTQDIRMASFAPQSTVPGLSVTREYFRLQTRRDASGHLVTVPDGKPAGNFRIGDRILARVTLKSPHPLEYLMLEDPLPAGWEVQDRGEVPFQEWEYWWSDMEVRDDRIAFFVRTFEPGKTGTQVLEYYLRPEVTGKVQALPAVLSDMYNPAVRASTSENKLEVGR
jgi:hypothetical protein